MEKLQEITLDAYDRIVGLELSDVEPSTAASRRLLLVVVRRRTVAR
jgi:hypothetical protein